MKAAKMTSNAMAATRPTGFMILAVPALLLFHSAAWLVAAADAEDSAIRFAEGDQEVQVSLGPQVVARYVFHDKLIPRPYFCDITTPDGTPVTRSHPPRDGIDRTDHPTFHPGVWMAFGDLGGADFWRNKARVRHLALQDVSASGSERMGFTVRNLYEAKDGPICEEICRIEFVPCSAGYFLLWSSTFTPAGESVAFGDQEEMGLGVRLATNLIVEEGGDAKNSHGHRDEAGAWGKQAAWCDYGRAVDGRRLGALVMPDPKNFRTSWFHVRDYGLVLANPFGRNAFTGGEKSRVVVDRERPLRLRFGICIYSAPLGDQAAEPETLYEEYLSLVD